MSTRKWFLVVFVVTLALFCAVSFIVKEHMARELSSVMADSSSGLGKMAHALAQKSLVADVLATRTAAMSDGKLLEAVRAGDVHGMVSATRGIVHSVIGERPVDVMVCLGDGDCGDRMLGAPETRGDLATFDLRLGDVGKLPVARVVVPFPSKWASSVLADFGVVIVDGSAITAAVRNSSGTVLAGWMAFLTALFAAGMCGLWVALDRLVLSKVEKTMEMVRLIRRTGDVRKAALSMDKSGEMRMLQTVLIGMASKLSAARRRAEKAAMLRSRFLANMSHEIRTPLNAIIGFSRVLSESDTASEDDKRMVKDIRISADQLLGVICDVMDMSKIESGGLEMSLTKVDLHNVIEEAVSVYGCKAAESALEFSLSVSPDLPRMVVTDGVRLKQVVGNLLTNAIKFTPDGHVRLSADRIDVDGVPWMSLSVEDSGIGIRDDKSIFDPFIQEDKAKDGIGLGLSICKRISEELGGHIAAQRLDKGSRFTVEIPLDVVDCGVPGECPLSDSEDFSGVKVLFAEDNAMNRKLLAKIVESLGLHGDTTVVENGVEAVRAVREGGFDIVFMDLNMPGMGGLEATSEIRDFDKDIPVIALTAHAMDKDRQRCLDVGMNGYVSKPFRKEDIANAIRSNVA